MLKWLDASGDGVVSAQEFLDAFRRLRRARASRAIVERGRAACGRVRALLRAHRVGARTWFATLDAGGGDGKVTGRELRMGLGRLLEQLGEPPLSM